MSNEVDDSRLKCMSFSVFDCLHNQKIAHNCSRVQRNRQAFLDLERWAQFIARVQEYLSTYLVTKLLQSFWCIHVLVSSRNAIDSTSIGLQADISASAIIYESNETYRGGRAWATED